MRTTRTLLAAAAIAVGISTLSQAQERPTWKVDVPFDFTVCQTHLPAGRYNVMSSGHVVMLSSQQGKTGTVLINNEYIPEPADHSSLTFRKDDGNYDLIKIKYMGSDLALNTVAGKRVPKPIAASVTAKVTAPQTVEVAAVGSR
jgi:hypothetical protein